MDNSLLGNAAIYGPNNAISYNLLVDVLADVVK
jgi:hypothetical protein